MNAEKVTTPALVKEVAARMGCYKKDAREVLEHFADVVGENVRAGKSAQFTGLGVLYPVISKRGVKVVKFRAATSLMDDARNKTKLTEKSR
ncbi:MAG TPA: hypothetical protein DCM26_00805 [Desulfotomaculum sp.]|nr:hypothetical protein [Desulfotomaculum sp.]